mmetsp:Transcript_82124/g.227778  ORF Transcript_82124/g.227778 Transcript_82124/m.227778 type:complete len:212 (-) Transcript_82124:194-829(-)|eukprot:CAMPEP_0179023622 /NCGR_PEP_ID=MMETSP0796-20121207/7027_1 /TAXON_ID=73915 /ORGANISM="Pyrodinium bahamense, Strain pbaha01" /LENGTH=211 /DNA_ID=CAMNT_0020719543 /DNA_START=165 /DNA_END=800 /DNA_ORIENTATION=-
MVGEDEVVEISEAGKAPHLSLVVVDGDSLLLEPRQEILTADTHVGGLFEGQSIGAPGKRVGRQRKDMIEDDPGSRHMELARDNSHFFGSKKVRVHDSREECVANGVSRQRLLQDVVGRHGSLHQKARTGFGLGDVVSSAGFVRRPLARTDQVGLSGMGWPGDGVVDRLRTGKACLNPRCWQTGISEAATEHDDCIEERAILRGLASLRLHH